jgi:predicted MFS family arabinose efflux permease
VRRPVTAQGRLRSAAFLSSFDRFTIPPLLVPIHEALGVSLGTAAVVASVYFVTYGATQPLWGGLSDRIGRVRVLRGAIAGGGIAALVSATAPTIAVLMIGRGLAGLFFAAAMPTAMTYIGDTVAERDRQPRLAVLMAFATAGVATGTIVGGVVAELWSWRIAFLASAVLAAGVSVLLAGLVEPDRPRPDGFLREVRAIARDRWVVAVVGIALVEGGVVFGSLTFVAASLQQQGIGAALAGSAAAGFGIANSACTPLVTRAIRRWSSPLLIGGGAALAAAGLLLAALDATVLTAVIATVALGAGFGFMHSTLQLWATQVRPDSRAVTISFFAGAVFFGGALASAAAAPLVDQGRFSAVFLIAALGAAGLALVGPLLRSRYLASRRPGLRAGDGEPAPVAP